METYQTSMITNIRHIYIRRLVSPVIYLLLLAVLWMAAPISELVFPPYVSTSVPFAELKNGHYTYITTTLTHLHFTGYTQKFFQYTNGYYYYTFDGGQCILVLLAPASCKEGSSDIDELTVHVRIIEKFNDYDALTTKLANDLNWTASGMQNQVPNYLLSEPAFNKFASLLLLSFYFISAIYAFVQACICITCILSPFLSPTCRRLGSYGNARELFTQAEEELALLRTPGLCIHSAMPQLATQNMYITAHFFIAYANDQAIVIPLCEILWIYKHSTMHKILRHHLRISYTLHITTKQGLYFQCPKNEKSNIDSIIDCLSEANPHILIGFNEENRTKVQKICNKSNRPVHLLHRP